MLSTNLGSIAISITYPWMFECFVDVNSLLRINTEHLAQQILGMIANVLPFGTVKIQLSDTDGLVKAILGP